MLQLLSQRWHVLSLPHFSPAPFPHFALGSAKALIYRVSRHCGDEIDCEKLLKISRKNSRMDFTYSPVTVIHDLLHLGLG